MDEPEVVTGATLTDNEFMAARYISKLHEVKEWKRLATMLLVVVIVESLILIFGGR